ncbi:MAG: hypothetical protein ACI81R_001907 [Bradymonadia bacterium]|jgi:hypothetical protein
MRKHGDVQASENTICAPCSGPGSEVHGIPSAPVAGVQSGDVDPALQERAEPSTTEVASEQGSAAEDEGCAVDWATEQLADAPKAELREVIAALIAPHRDRLRYVQNAVLDAQETASWLAYTAAGNAVQEGKGDADRLRRIEDRRFERYVRLSTQFNEQTRRTLDRLNATEQEACDARR